MSPEFDTRVFIRIITFHKDGDGHLLEATLCKKSQ